MAEASRLRVRDLLEVRPGPSAHRVALRAGISVLVPLLAVLVLGPPEWSPYAAFGAFPSLYGRNHRTPDQRRAAAPGIRPFTTVLVVAVLQIVTELIVGRHYGATLLFIRPMAMLMGQLAAPLPVRSLLFDRGVETVIGAVVDTLLVVVLELVRRRRGP